MLLLIYHNMVKNNTFFKKQSAAIDRIARRVV